MFDKIEIFSKRYDELNNRLYDPTVASDATKFNEIMKEVKSIEPIVLNIENTRKHNRQLKIALKFWKQKKTRKSENLPKWKWMRQRTHWMVLRKN